MYAISYGRSLSTLSNSSTVVPTTLSIPAQPFSRELCIALQSNVPNSPMNNALNQSSI